MLGGFARWRPQPPQKVCERQGIDSVLGIRLLTGAKKTRFVVILQARIHMVAYCSSTQTFQRGPGGGNSCVGLPFVYTM